MSTFELFVLLAIGHLSAQIVHELGHLLTARYFGVRVLGVSIGLGFEVVGFHDLSGTRWSLCAIPLGSCTKMVDERELSSNTFAVSSKLIVNDSGSLSSRSLLKRAAIYGAGPFANFLVTPATLALSQLFFVGQLVWPSTIDYNSSMALALGLYSPALGLYNLVPLPLHDGRKLMLLCVEWLREARGFPSDNARNDRNLRSVHSSAEADD
jgi:membrane-associated protease RseP (regulator of RpoE activity)